MAGRLPSQCGKYFSFGNYSSSVFIPAALRWGPREGTLWNRLLGRGGCGEGPAGSCDGGPPGAWGFGGCVGAQAARAAVWGSTRLPAAVPLLLCETRAPALSLSFPVCPVGVCTAGRLRIWDADAVTREGSGCPAPFSRLLEASSASWSRLCWPSRIGGLRVFPSEVMETGLRADRLPGPEAGGLPHRPPRGWPCPPQKARVFMLAHVHVPTWEGGVHVTSPSDQGLLKGARLGRTAYKVPLEPPQALNPKLCHREAPLDPCSPGGGPGCQRGPRAGVSTPARAFSSGLSLPYWTQSFGTGFAPPSQSPGRAAGPCLRGPQPGPGGRQIVGPGRTAGGALPPTDVSKSHLPDLRLCAYRETGSLQM